MKKTLIALAVVAASGAAFAQSSVTLSGKFGYAYTANKTAGGDKTNGFGTTDGDVVFAATEDLGGGLKAGASMALKLRGRDNAVSATSGTSTTTTTGGNGVALTNAASNVVGGRDASVFLSGGFGTITAGAIEAGNGIIGRASAGAPTIGQDSGVTLDGAANVDIVTYTTPALAAGLTATVMVIDSIGNPGADGLQAAATTQAATVFDLNYANGPVSAGIDTTSFGQNAAASTGTDSRVRMSVSYDLGVVKLGAGYQTKKTYAGVKDTQTMVGVSMPAGAWTLGATYAVRNNDVNTSDAKGWELGANYAFSKRTALQIATRDLSINSAASATATRVRLLHSF
jgi:predicted porin